ncbi:hypothetical protein CgunFtcFv8_010385 [Champsocephalus gunnari]|uniref:Serpin domain-containing protein n=1 Tax=Champsocephalus gunnari TaxID=52237 RepID=A0AAN8HZE5_CHAGU|nr:hypothetical protein CgunFtcFv8_010385 [Champsocephalus gunnari]
MEVSHNLQKHLAEFGLTEAVDKAKADLSNISGKKDLYLSNVFHASAMEMDVTGNPVRHQHLQLRKAGQSPTFLRRSPLHFPVEGQQE